MSIIEEALNRLKTDADGGHSGPDTGLALQQGLVGYHTGTRRQAYAVRLASWLGAFTMIGIAAWVVLGNLMPINTISEDIPLARQIPQTVRKTASNLSNKGTTDVARSPTSLLLELDYDLGPALPKPLGLVSARTDDAPTVNWREVGTPDWVSEGRHLYLSGDRKSALATWNAGFSTLPDTTPIIALSAYPDPSGAFAALSHLRDFNGAFVATSVYRGKPAWRVFLFADATDWRTKAREASSRLGVRFWEYIPVRSLKLHTTQVAPARLTVADTKTQTSAKNHMQSVDPSNTTRLSITSFDKAATALLTGIEQNKPEAISLANVLAHAYPERTDTLLWRARAELIAGQVDLAEKTLALAASQTPHLAEVWILRGIAAQERNRHDEALSFLEEAHRLAPKDPDALFNLALSAQMIGALDRASAAAQAFLELTRDKSEYSNQRAVMMRYLQNYRNDATSPSK